VKYASVKYKIKHRGDVIAEIMNYLSYILLSGTFSQLLFTNYLRCLKNNN